MLANCRLCLTLENFAALAGGAVYLGSTTSSNSGVFVVVVDDDQSKLDGFITSNTNSGCLYTFSKMGLTSGLHNLMVIFQGKSPQSQSEAEASFELNGFQYVSQLYFDATPTELVE